MTGAAVVSVVGLIYFYSIAAVKQDDFSDVPAPSADQRDRIRKEMDEEKARASVPEEVLSKKKAGGDKETQTRLPSLGLLGSAAFLSARVREEGLVEGAPPLDRLGTSRDRSTVAGQPRQV